jgi:DNA helicase-2/ATP-dependent DNA helicase PcrA
LAEFLAIIDNLREIAQTAVVSELVEKVLFHSGYLKELQLENTVESESRIENLKELISVAQEQERNYPDLDLAAFLEQVALTADVDTMGDKPSGVTLMTLHTAKGLEFPVVFLVGLEEGIFPGTQALYDDNQLEEERRLAYVGITRAMERLYCTYTWERTLYGRRDNKPKSRFLDEIPFDLLVMADEEDREFKKNANISSGGSSKQQTTNGMASRMFGGSATITTGQAVQPVGIDASTIKVGDKVQHAKFGVGTVVSIKGEGEDATITIAFNANGIKSFMAGMAPIQKV